MRRLFIETSAFEAKVEEKGGAELLTEIQQSILEKLSSLNLSLGG